MPKSNANDTPTDGNTAQWDKVKAMRDANAAAARGEPSGTPVQVVGMEPTPPPAAEPTPRQLPDRDPETGKFVAATPDGAPAPGSETPKEEPRTAAPAPTPPAAAPTAAPVAPAVREVLIDGVKVNLDPALADAFERAEKIKNDNAKITDREALKDELRQELRQELAPPTKSPAEIAAEEALAEAERLKSAPKKPDGNLAITDPAEYERQRDAYEDWRVDEKVRQAKNETLREVRSRDVATAKAQEAEARAVLREQFYGTYPVLKDSADIVDIMFTKAMDDLVASGRLKTPPPPAEREKMKAALFADVASQATRRLVKLMSGGKKVAPPAAPEPPALVSSAPKPAAKPPVEPKPEPKAKYPKGSVSAALAERRARLLGTSA